ncbi:autotransporter outer membrane beta-barrel domain-containing protein, partial [Mesorhizobium sp. CN2-181]
MADGIDLRRPGVLRWPIAREAIVQGWLPATRIDAGDAPKRSLTGSDQVRKTQRRAALHVLIVSALSVGGAAIAGQAQASCSGAASQNLGEGSYGYTWSICNGAAGTDCSGEKDGAWGDNITITSEGTYATSAGSPPYSQPGGVVGGVIMLYSRGGDGVDEGNAGGGGSIDLTTHNSITVNGTGNSGYLGSMISAYSWGGNGDSDNDNNDSDGGDGGAGSAINVTNYGTMTIDGTVSPLSGGMYGIIAVSGGGTGGEQNNSVSGLGDQVGGDGGSSGSVTVTNAGTISIGSTSSRMQGNAAGAGIYADSGGGGGGVHNGGAGNGGSVTVQNSGQINNVWNGQGSGEIYGIHARSIGGIGTQSIDNSDDGGRGGDGSTVTVTSSGGILLDVTGNFTGSGAGIAAVSQGEDGGEGPSEDHSAGNGGTGKAVSVTLQGPSGNVTTNGANLYGILAESLGGQGGDGGDSTALAGTGGGGGFGGDGGTVNVTTDAGTFITTSGEYAAGIAAMSLGGGGGTGSDFNSILGGSGGNGGNGGNSGAVTVDNGAEIRTGGDYAYGILGQSTAGSGGTGGVGNGFIVELGGDGGAGGTTNTVDIDNSGTI